MDRELSEAYTSALRHPKNKDALCAAILLESSRDHANCSRGLRSEAHSMETELSHILFDSWWSHSDA